MSLKIDFSNSKNWLGPFPCKPAENQMSLWMSFGPKSPAKNVLAKARLKKEHDSPWIQATVTEIFSNYNVQILTFNTLAADSEYIYEVTVDGNIWIGEDLTPDDFFFRTFSSNNNETEIVFMSCHGVEAYEKDPKTNSKDTWNMWSRLRTTLKGNTNIRLGILGGDQVYMDETFGEDLSNFQIEEPEITKLMVYQTYLKYWGNSDYRRVMIQLPCYLMWDDHDIIDGWGSRNEQLKTTTPDAIKEFLYQKFLRRKFNTKKEKWRHYGSYLFTAFDEMQASRNPPTIPESCSTFLKKIGSNAILSLDMRRERGENQETGNPQILSKKHRDAIDAKIKNLNDCENIFIVSPVTLARMSGKIEFLLGSISNFMWKLGSHLTYRKSPARVAYWSVLFLAGYWALYTESERLPGVIQAATLFIFLIFMTVFNSKNLQEFFPNKGKSIRNFLFVISIALSVYIAWKTLPFIKNEERSLRDLLSIANLKIHEIDSAIGAGLSLIVIFYFSILNWSKTNKYLKKIHKDKDSLAKTRKLMLSLGVGILVFLAIFNWWRGLPGLETSFENIILLAPYALLGICVLICFLMAVFEGMGVVDTIAGLNDDVMDAWSSPEHVESLKWFLNLIFKLSNNGQRKIFLLCGDIHTGGLSEISFQNEYSNKKTSLFQITSSPMSYVTMPALVEKITSGVGKVPLKESQKLEAPTICEFTNIFFRSQRNYVVLKHINKELQVSYYFEDLEVPVKHII